MVSKTDRDLVQLAAQAMQYGKIHQEQHGKFVFIDVESKTNFHWNPLSDIKDAIALLSNFSCGISLKITPVALIITVDSKVTRIAGNLQDEGVQLSLCRELTKLCANMQEKLNVRNALN